MRYPAFARLGVGKQIVARYCMGPDNLLAAAQMSPEIRIMHATRCQDKQAGYKDYEESTTRREGINRASIRYVAFAHPRGDFQFVDQPV